MDRCVRYNWPLFEIVGFTNTGENFNIAFVLFGGESTKHYEFAASNLQTIMVGLVPEALVTDRELGLIKALKAVFPNTPRLLCMVHVMRDIRAYIGRLINLKDQKKFVDACEGLFASRSIDSYQRRLTKMHEEWGTRAGLMRYLETTWLGQHKEALVRCWTNRVRHFGTTSTNR